MCLVGNCAEHHWALAEAALEGHRPVGSGPAGMSQERCFVSLLSEEEAQTANRGKDGDSGPRQPRNQTAERRFSGPSPPNLPSGGHLKSGEPDFGDLTLEPGEEV